MGRGIENVWDMEGYKVILNDEEKERMEKGIDKINGNMERKVD